MKKILIPIMLLLVISLVSGSFGGEKILLEDFTNCENIEVNVTGELEIEPEEYIINDCEEIESNYWFCTCIDNQFNLSYTPSLLAVNEYIFNINYSVSVESTNKNLNTIVIENPDLVVENISYENNILEIILTGNGLTNVSIDTGEFGEPSEVKVDSISVDFTYSNGMVLFTTTFSTRTITFSYPTSSVSTGSSGGSSGSSGSSSGGIYEPPFVKNKDCWDNLDCDGNSICERIEGEIYKQCVEIEIEDEEPSQIDDVCTENCDEEEPEPIKEKSKAIWWVLLILSVILIILWFYLKGSKKESKELDEELKEEEK